MVTTTLNQADLGYIKDWDSASAMVLLESFIIRAASDARVATAITSAELFAESGNKDLFNCCGCLRADACHDHPDLYPGANKAGRAATVARLVLLQAVKAGVEGFGACVSSYSNDGKVLTVVFFETSSGCLIPQGTVVVEIDALFDCTGQNVHAQRHLRGCSQLRQSEHRECPRF